MASAPAPGSPVAWPATGTPTQYVPAGTANVAWPCASTTASPATLAAASAVSACTVTPAAGRSGALDGARPGGGGAPPPAAICTVTATVPIACSTTGGASGQQTGIPPSWPRTTLPGRQVATTSAAVPIRP